MVNEPIFDPFYFLQTSLSLQFLVKMLDLQWLSTQNNILLVRISGTLPVIRRLSNTPVG